MQEVITLYHLSMDATQKQITRPPGHTSEWVKHHTETRDLVLWFAVSFCFWMIVTAYRTMYRSSTSSLLRLQRRSAHAKPDFNWLSGPRNGTWKRTSPFPSSNVAICDAAPPRQHSPILRTSALLRYSVLCFNSSAQCNWHDIERMAE